MRYSKLARWLLDRVILPQYRSRVHRTYFRGLERIFDEIPASAPLLIVVNHTSWWDAFILLELQKRIRLGCEIYTIALQSTLKAHPFLGRVGLLPLTPGSPGSLLALTKTIRNRLHRGGNPAPLFVFFPQGKIRPAWARPLDFKSGVELLAREILKDGAGAVLPVGVIVEPLQQKSPSVFISCAAPIQSLTLATKEGIEAAVTRELDEGMALLAEHGEEVVRHWENSPTASSARPS